MGKTIRWGLACALAVCCSSAAAQGKEIWEEYGKRVTASASVSANTLYGSIRHQGWRG